MLTDTTICAIATPPGNGAIALIRLSGTDAITIASKIFYGKKPLEEKISHRLSFGEIRDENELIDEVLVSLFRAPNSYTGENMIEMSCHASSFIQQKIISLLLENGAILAQPGEFTQRAYLNGKFDLSQAEAVADIISSQTEASHKMAMQQMRGGYSEELKELRKQLLHFVSLIELELDFSEEDVEFADRTQLVALAEQLHSTINHLAQSFHLGNAIKKGIPVAIVGKPNVGKSTLLNALLGEERAIVSEIAGTTRDVVEDTIIIKGVEYRFIDTAGIRETQDTIESLGIERTWQKIDMAEIVLFLADATDSLIANLNAIKKLQDYLEGMGKTLLLIINKTDLKPVETEPYSQYISKENILSISAKYHKNTDILIEKLHTHYLGMKENSGNIIVSNLRHYELLKKAEEATQRILEGLYQGIPTDFISQDIREALHHLGSITGEISTDDILGSIFQNFCIGK
ncbi:tRNA modification GTPase [Balneicella halophila]|uniref:tRNA modification GTPase MnmE n=1 Tax=Balneicella halophila TaxID=1537566 RepID=A0A7L4UNN7_BALHA|nr:tRNA uridine-5-carboxymethylaminomethyl(34) synthesis GTPase MnmE [Balneicella halophila]PVX50803.1 tRNA modification GTPase [Balneicella halophila]